ncbi:unnamed protein product [Sphagnum balticum]
MPQLRLLRMELKRLNGWSAKVAIGGGLCVIPHRSVRWSLARPCLEIGFTRCSMICRRWSYKLSFNAEHAFWEERVRRSGSFTIALHWRRRGSVSRRRDLLACRREGLGTAAAARARFVSLNPKRIVPSFPYPTCN